MITKSDNLSHYINFIKLKKKVTSEKDDFYIYNDEKNVSFLIILIPMLKTLS